MMMRSRRGRRLFWLVFGLIGSLAEFSPAVVLDADFDQGSLDVANSSVNGSIVQLAGRDNYNPGNWKWIYFEAADVAGQSLVFQIDDDFETGGGNLVGHEMVYSYDQQTWAFFDNNQRNAAANTFSFWNDTPFCQPQVYVAYGLPYPLSRAITHTESITSNPWVMPTPSADARLVIGPSPGGIDDLGRTIPPHDLFGYRIMDPVGVPDRTDVVLAGGVHANETLGNYVLEGLVDFLTGDAFDAALLRKYADFHVYPMINPDGRFAGYNRSTVANESQDPESLLAPQRLRRHFRIGDRRDGHDYRYRRGRLSHRLSLDGRREGRPSRTRVTCDAIRSVLAVRPRAGTGVADAASNADHRYAGEVWPRLPGRQFLDHV